MKTHLNGDEIEEELKKAEKALETVLSSLAGNTEAVHCVAEGRLDVALYAVKEVINMQLMGAADPEPPAPPTYPPHRSA